MKNSLQWFVAKIPSPQAVSREERFWEFSNESGKPNEATLYIYGDIVRYDMGNWNCPDDVVPNKFKNELKAIGDVDTIYLRINSNGGSVFAAYAIRSMLKAHKAKVIAYNDGLCASAATIIATAADKVISSIGALWLYHLPSAPIWGSYNSGDLKKIMQELESITDSMIEIYQTKTGMDKKELLAFLEEDVFITGTTAMEKGFVDEVSDIEAVAYLSEDKATAFFNDMPVDVTSFKNRDGLEKLLPVRKAHRDKGQRASRAIASVCNTTADNTQNTNETEVIIMDLKDLQEKYPDIYNAARQEGYQEGVTAERARIKGIEDISLPGMDGEASKAKFDSGVTAQEFAVSMIKAQKAKGLEFFKSAVNDAAALNGISVEHAPGIGEEANAAQREALLSAAEEIGHSLRAD